MKIGDMIFSTKVRPNDTATIIKADVVIKWKETKTGKKKETRTKYIAKYPDGSEITFYGFNINKSIFKRMRPSGQITLEDYMNPSE